MTIKFTDEAVEAAAKAIQPLLWDESTPTSRHAHSAREEVRDEARAALEAALPHLEGATPGALSSLDKAPNNSAGVLEHAAPKTAAAIIERATPAIDREALEKLIDGAEHYDTCDLRLSPLTNQFGCSCLLADLRALIGGGK